jgi:hypothetical protein
LARTGIESMPRTRANTVGDLPVASTLIVFAGEHPGAVARHRVAIFDCVIVTDADALFPPGRTPSRGPSPPSRPAAPAHRERRRVDGCLELAVSVVCEPDVEDERRDAEHDDEHACDRQYEHLPALVARCHPRYLAIVIAAGP